MKNPTLKLCVTLFIILLIIAVSIILVGCNSNPNKQASTGFTYAMVRLPDGSTVGGKVSKYSIGTYNGKVCIVIDGVEYSTHIANAVLTREAEQ